MARRTSKAFTLVELLLVVSILALLIALLLPALQSAREMGKTTRCRTQQRQIGVSIGAYTADSLGLWPVSSYAYCSHNQPSDPWYPQNHNSALWATVVAHYAKNPYITEFPTNAAKFPNDAKFLGYTNVPKPNQGILKCPSENYTNFWGSTLAVSYGYNGRPFGMGVNEFFDHHWVDVYNGQKVYKDSYGRVRTAQILKPATTVLIADEEQEGGYEYAGYHFHQGPADLAPHHQEASNILWADGHATTRKPETVTLEDFDRRY